MSNNPFFDLADALQALNEGGENMYVSLRAQDPNEDEYAAHARILTRLFEAQDLLGAIEADDEAYALLREIHVDLLRVSSDWGLGKPHFGARDLSMLRYIGRDVASHGVLPAPLTAQARQALQSALEKIQDHITGNATSFPENSLAYLRYLVARCLDLLQGEDVDVVALRALSVQAGSVALCVGASIPNEEERNSFWEACKPLVNTWIAPVFTGTTGALIAEGVTRLLGS